MLRRQSLYEGRRVSFCESVFIIKGFACRAKEQSDNVSRKNA